MKNILFYIILIFALSSCLGIKNTSTENNTATSTESTSKELVPTENMTCHHQVLENGSTLRIFLELDIPRLRKDANGQQVLKEEFLINYGLLESYSSKEYTETRKIDITANNTKKSGKNYYVYFDIEKKKTISSVLIVDITDTKTGKKIFHDLPLQFAVTKIRERFAAFDKQGKVPHFGNYLLTKDTIQIRNINKDDKKLIVRYFHNVFQAANPPMSVNNPGKTPPKKLPSDSVFTIQTNQTIQFRQTGLYFIQEDTSNFYGLSFYVSDRKYPKLSRVKDVIEPLVYITTKEEYEDLMTSEENKKELDKLWLKLTSGNVGRAKQTIREYYKRVKMANKFFTTYKEGWKTDMGMIFIIYGNPNRVVRTNDAEHWFYTQTASFSEIKFSFARKPNQFTENHYNLIRYPEYEQVWYPVIELWREGKI